MIIDVQSEMREVKQAINEIGETMPKLEKKILVALGSKVKTAIKKVYFQFLKKGTGDLYKSLISKIARDGKSIAVFPKKTNDKVHYGFSLAAGYTIRPKHGEFLTFKIGSKWVRAQEVNVKARSWVKTPSEAFIDGSDYRNTIQSVIDKEVARIMK